MKCEICGRKTKEEMSCSAMPLADVRCCQVCDDLIITPIRILSHMNVNTNEIVAVFVNAMRTHKLLQIERRKYAKANKAQPTG